MNRSFLEKDIRSTGISITRLRLLRREPTNRKEIEAYTRLIRSIAPDERVWVETPQTHDGWEYLASKNISKAQLKGFWDEEEIELQQLDENGEWVDVFKI